MTTYYAIAKIKGTNATEVLVKDYPTAKAFKEDLKLSGYVTKLVFTDADYDKAVAKLKADGFFSLNAREELLYETINNM